MLLSALLPFTLSLRVLSTPCSPALALAPRCLYYRDCQPFLSLPLAFTVFSPPQLLSADAEKVKKLEKMLSEATKISIDRRTQLARCALRSRVRIRKRGS